MTAGETTFASGTGGDVLVPAGKGSNTAGDRAARCPPQASPPLLLSFAPDDPPCVGDVGGGLWTPPRCRPCPPGAAPRRWTTPRRPLLLPLPALRPTRPGGGTRYSTPHTCWWDESVPTPRGARSTPPPPGMASDPPPSSTAGCATLGMHERIGPTAPRGGSPHPPPLDRPTRPALAAALGSPCSRRTALCIRPSPRTT